MNHVPTILLLGLLLSVSLVPLHATATTQQKYLTIGWVGGPDTSDGPIFTIEALSALSTQIPCEPYDALGAIGELSNTVITFGVVPVKQLD
jgi:hypothetical protein